MSIYYDNEEERSLAPANLPIGMKTQAVLFEEPKHVDVRQLTLVEPEDGDIVVKSLWSGISTGTEKRLFEGSMPFFPGLAYPLVPGYETVGRVVDTRPGSDLSENQLVLIPGSRCFKEAAGLFGASASTLVTKAEKAVPLDERIAQEGTLLSLAATAYHALTLPQTPVPNVIVGHGVLGRLAARLLIALGHPEPVVWETNPVRRTGAGAYEVTTPEASAGKVFDAILDASGDPAVIDLAVRHLKPGGTIILAGFYDDRMSFEFAPAFMREARIVIAAEFRPADLIAVSELVTDGSLSLTGLITHSAPARDARAAYQTAFNDPSCVKMILEWEAAQ